ncbi:MAG: phosphatase PAP2 family protein [Hydrogenophaga sp.]|nr:phosphatase PAP2 family protein [Hydrogenophaga sp.]
MRFQHSAARSEPSPTRPGRPVPLGRWALLVVGLTLAWDGVGADLAVMQAIGGPNGFALRDHWLLSQWLHDGLRQVAVLLYLLLWAWAAWPVRWQVGPAALWSLPRHERLGAVLLVTLSLLAVSLIKHHSQTSCPWELQAFGGAARYVSHWALGQNDGGGGRCFPGGHASSAFAFVALCLPWLQPPPGRARARATGWRWLGVVLLAGAVAGAVQTLRGAHYPSHTLWTLLICAAVSWGGWTMAVRWMSRP